MVIRVDGPPLPFRDIILLVLDKFRALRQVLLPHSLLINFSQASHMSSAFSFFPFFCPAFCLLGFLCFGIFLLLFPVAMLILLGRIPACRSLFPKGRFLFLGFLWPGFPLSDFFLFSELMYYLLSDRPGCFVLSGLLLGSGFGRSFLLIGFFSSDLACPNWERSLGKERDVVSGSRFPGICCGC